MEPGSRLAYGDVEGIRRLHPGPCSTRRNSAGATLVGSSAARTAKCRDLFLAAERLAAVRRFLCRHEAAHLGESGALDMVESERGTLERPRRYRRGHWPDYSTRNLSRPGDHRDGK